MGLLGDALPKMNTSTEPPQVRTVSAMSARLQAAIYPDPLLQYLEFPCGLPSKYFPVPMLLNLSVSIGTGVSNMTRLLV